MLVFEGRGKPEKTGEKSLGAKKRTNNKLNPHMVSRPGFGHVTGRRALSPLRYPLLHGEYSPRIRLGDYSLIFTSPEATNCFSIITLMIIRENKSIDQFPTPKHKKIWLPF